MKVIYSWSYTWNNRFETEMNNINWINISSNYHLSCNFFYTAFAIWIFVIQENTLHLLRHVFVIFRWMPSVALALTLSRATPGVNWASESALGAHLCLHPRWNLIPRRVRPIVVEAASASKAGGGVNYPSGELRFWTLTTTELYSSEG